MRPLSTNTAIFSLLASFIYVLDFECDMSREKVPSVDGNGPDKTAHLRSLIWAFAVRLQNRICLSILFIVSMKNQDPNEIVQESGMIGTYAVRTCSKAAFPLTTLVWYKPLKYFESVKPIDPKYW